MTKTEMKLARTIIDGILKDGEQALREQGLDVRLALGRGTYDTAGGGHFRLQIDPVDEESGDVMTPEAVALERHAFLWGLKPGARGAIFQAQGEEFELVGAKPRSPKYPFIGRRLKDNKQFKFGTYVAGQIKAKYPHLQA